jgi:hypothetical protein
MEKSYVTVEQYACPVCGKTFDSGNLLLDKRMRDRFEMKTTTGFVLCPEHERMKNDGYVALVECDEKRSKMTTDVNGNTSVKQEDAYRTGRLMHVRAEAFKRIFNVPVPKGMIVFIEPEVFDKLQPLGMPQEEWENQNNQSDQNNISEEDKK